MLMAITLTELFRRTSSELPFAKFISKHVYGKERTGWAFTEASGAVRAVAEQLGSPRRPFSVVCYPERAYPEPVGVVSWVQRIVFEDRQLGVREYQARAVIRGLRSELEEKFGPPVREYRSIPGVSREVRSRTNYDAEQSHCFVVPVEGADPGLVIVSGARIPDATEYIRQEQRSYREFAVMRPIV